MGESQPQNITTNYIKVGIILSTVICLAVVVYFWFSVKNNIGQSVAVIVPSILPIETEDVEFFRYTSNVNASSTEVGYRFFKTSLGLEDKEVETHSFTIPNVSQVSASGFDFLNTTSLKKNIILFIKHMNMGGVVYSLDLSLLGSVPKVVLTVPRSRENEIIQDAVFFDNGTKIGVILATHLPTDLFENVVVKIFSLEDQKQLESYVLSQEGKLQNHFVPGSQFKFLSLTSDTKKIYIAHMGGGVNVSYKESYSIDRETKIIQKIKQTPGVFEGLLFRGIPAVLSPDSSRSIGVTFSQEIDSKDIDNANMTEEGMEDFCLKKHEELLKKYPYLNGALLMYDMVTGTTTEIYKDDSDKNVYCQNIEDRVFDIAWADNSQVVFTKINGMYLLNVNTGEKKTILTFEKISTVSEIDIPRILFVQLPYIVFTDGRAINTKTTDRISPIYSDRKEGEYFEVIQNK